MKFRYSPVYIGWVIGLFDTRSKTEYRKHKDANGITIFAYKPMDFIKHVCQLPPKEKSKSKSRKSSKKQERGTSCQ